MQYNPQNIFAFDYFYKYIIQNHFKFVNNYKRISLINGVKFNF